eukprot:3466058-Alexandrium_andersonii.AAC.1
MGCARTANRTRVQLRTAHVAPSAALPPSRPRGRSSPEALACKGMPQPHRLITMLGVLGPRPRSAGKQAPEATSSILVTR